MLVVREKWEQVFTDGFAPHLSTGTLTVLADALERDDRRLIQGGTTQPPPLDSLADKPCEAGCLFGYAGAAANGGFATNADGTPNPDACPLGKAEQFFAEVCYAADETLGEPAACRHFLNWFDDTPRETMRRELLPVIRRALETRKALPCP